MFSLPLPWRDSLVQFTLPGEGFSPLWQFATVILAMIGCLLPFVLILWLYFYEARIISRGLAVGLLSLRLTALALLLF